MHFRVYVNLSMLMISAGNSEMSAHSYKIYSYSLTFHKTEMLPVKLI